MQLVVAVVQVKLPGDEVAVYEEMVPPPVATGAVQATTDWVLAFELAVTPVGAPGVPTTRALDAAEGPLVPAELVAVTVKV